jgi:dTDP-4-dehydrorhamnose reductase
MTGAAERVLVTGGAGLLGGALLRSAPVGAELHATRRRAPVAGAPSHPVELSDSRATRTLFQELRPALVIHTAYSMDAGERDVWQATCSVVDAALEAGAELVYLSTDALLDGEHGPYAEDAPPRPVHEYGRWKARAEEYVAERAPAAAIVRTSLVTSLEPVDPRTAWVVAGLRGEHPITLFTDEIRCPVAVDDLARQIWEVTELPPERRAGRWHLAGPEALSRYALGLLIAARFGLSPERLVAAESGAAPGTRPRDLRLLTGRADRDLRTRARPVSQLLAPPLASTSTRR